MKNKLLKRAFLFVTVITMIIPGFIVFADSNNYIEKDIGIKSSAWINFYATSNNKATAQVSATANGIMTSITSVITLQSAPSGTSNFTTVSGISPETKTVYNTSTIFHETTFPITTQKDYRIKTEITEYNGVVKKTSIQYKNLS